MKFLFFASLIAACVAQSVDITIPAPDSVITAGQDFLVQISRPDSMDVSIEEAIVISMVSCDPTSTVGNCNSPSYNPSDDLGIILYNGSYTPQHFNPPEGWPFPSFYENFTVQAPQSEPAQVALIVTHFSLIGLAPQPFLEVKNIVLNVSNPTS